MDNNYNNDFNMNNNYELYNNQVMYNNHPKKKSNLIKWIIVILLIVALGFIVLNLFDIELLTKEYHVTFALNGADEIETMEVKCQSNFNRECQVTLPVAKRNNGEVLGYSRDMNSKEAEYKIGDQLHLTSDMDLYVISKKENKLIIDKSNVDEVRDGKTSCIVYNNEKACEVDIPMFNKKGYEIQGYTKEQGNNENLIPFGSTYELNDSITIYPVYEEYPIYEGETEKVIGRRHLNIEKSVYINDTYVDIGYNCNQNVINSLINNIKTIYEKLPFYAYHNKIVVLGEKDYETFADNHSDSAGLTDELEYKNPSIVIRCEEYYTTYMYMAVVHELSHALDIRYKNISGHFLNEEKDIANLRNKYANSSNRPLRDYAYTYSKGMLFEFFAELMTYYYINYIDTSIPEDMSYRRGNFPDDMKKIAEKYLCIGRNNYDFSKCS